MKTHEKGSLMEIWQVFGTFHMLTVKARSKTAVFTEWSDEVIHSL